MEKIENLPGLFAMLAIFFFGVSADSAHIIGNWIALLCAALCGAFTALGMADTKDWSGWRVGYFVLIRLLWAAVLTMSIVRFIGIWLPDFGPSFLLAPVALLIACDPLRAWALSVANKVMDIGLEALRSRIK